VVASRAPAQERGAIALGEAVQGLGVNTRVLVIGAHPDDEDTFLIAWLSRGRHVETAYLSLTRGDGGQNLIGNELGEALGVIRTEELLAARRVDGAKQFFTRAFDFGFSKDTIDTYKHWNRDSILADVVQAIRYFRPHVVVAVFSGTPRDGHGHHQVSGLLAREAFDAAADTVRFPASTWTPAWTPLKFYRAARFNPDGGTLRFDVGEYSPLLGRSYAEIAGESRSQHKSQGFGILQRRGQIFDFLRREASRVNESSPAANERSIFDGIDTSWARFRNALADPRARAALDSLPAVFADARNAYDAFRPGLLIRPLARALRLLRAACVQSHDGNCVGPSGADQMLRRDMGASARIAGERLAAALQLAAGIDVEAIATREAFPVRTAFPVSVALYNRGDDSVFVSRSVAADDNSFRLETPLPLARGATRRDTARLVIPRISQSWWLERPRRGDMFDVGGFAVPERDWRVATIAAVEFGHGLDTVTVPISADVLYRVADPVKGEIRRAVAGVPAIAVKVEQETQYVVANADFGREFNVRIRSADEKPRDVRVRLALPRGVTADSASRAARLAGYDATETITFRLRGRLPVGEHRIAAIAESDGETFTTGYDLIDYDHIRRQRIYRPATTTLSAVDMRVPSTLRVAYITGVGDNVAPTLEQLGVPVTLIGARDLARVDLQHYTTIVIGPRAYEAHPELVAANARLFEFARKGGTLVVQYGQYEMTQPGAMPYPITLARPADRVTEEDSPVTIDAPDEKVLGSPNRIGASDFAGWVQERALYMPRTFDEHYRAPLAMHDTGEPPNKGAILVAPLGEGLYIYTTLSLFRQLPAGVPGGARLFLNLLSAGLVSPNVNP
jgi:LmbE family N-acetylglucosaminyl deacetylase